MEGRTEEAGEKKEGGKTPRSSLLLEEILFSSSLSQL